MLIKATILTTLLFFIVSCGQISNKSACKDTLADSVVVDEYVADNDIAMTIRSIIDAISVGEPLDTAEYNFNGVLTDGEGMPLYTDIQGNPGEWEIDVTSDKSVRIHNLYLGDLLPEHLTKYLTLSLNLTDTIPDIDVQEDNDEETSTEIFHFDSGNIKIETREAFAPNGLEGPLMSIVISSSNKVHS